MWLVEFSLAHRIPVACFSCHKINKISISCLNYSRKQEILLKNLLQNQQNLKARGIYSCTGIYFFKSARHHIPSLLSYAVLSHFIHNFIQNLARNLILCLDWKLFCPLFRNQSNDICIRSKSGTGNFQIVRHNHIGVFLL